MTNLTLFDWVALTGILAVSLLGGYIPLFHQERAREVEGFPQGQAFAAGVFLALSLVLMLPAGFSLFSAAFPKAVFPLAPVIALCAFLILLSLEHRIERLRNHETTGRADLSPPIIPIIMTVMIAIPSFLLGTALGVSGSLSAVMIFIAIVAHKGSAGFALALKMVRSTMKRAQVLFTYCCFALATPAGIVVGNDAHQYLAGQTMVVVKGIILSLASGVFLYMATLHELQNTPLIVDVRSRKGFMLMLAGFTLTALVRLLMGEAHKFH